MHHNKENQQSLRRKLLYLIKEANVTKPNDPSRPLTQSASTNIFQSDSPGFELGQYDQKEEPVGGRRLLENFRKREERRGSAKQKLQQENSLKKLDRQRRKVQFDYTQRPKTVGDFMQQECLKKDGVYKPDKDHLYLLAQVQNRNRYESYYKEQEQQFLGKLSVLREIEGQKPPQIKFGKRFFELLLRDQIHSQNLQKQFVFRSQSKSKFQNHLQKTCEQWAQKKYGVKQLVPKRNYLQLKGNGCRPPRLSLKYSK